MKITLLITVIGISFWTQAANRPDTGRVIPTLEGKTLSGKPIRLPADLGDGSSVLIVGFSEKASDQGILWGEAIAQERDCRSASLQWFELPVLTGVPKLLRPVVTRAIRSGLSPSARDHFVPIISDEEAWKRAVGVSNPDDVYIVVSTAGGTIVSVTQGSFNSARLAQVKRDLDGLCHRS